VRISIEIVKIAEMTTATFAVGSKSPVSTLYTKKRLTGPPMKRSVRIVLRENV